MNFRRRRISVNYFEPYVVLESVGEVSEEKVVEDILESEPFMNQARSTRLSWQHLPTRVKGLFPGKKCLIGVFRLI